MSFFPPRLFSLVLALMLPFSGPANASQGPVIHVGPSHLVFAGRDAPTTEPHIAASPTDPNRLAAAAILAGRGQTIVAAWSADGGVTWRESDLPGIAQASFAADPWLAWDRTGRVTLAVLPMVQRLGDQRFPIWVYLSEDGGRRWAGPTEVSFGPEPRSYDHEIIAVPVGGGAPARFVMAATQGLSGLSVFREEDGGTWSDPAQYVPDEKNNNLGGAIAIGGTVVFTYFDMSTPSPERPLWAVRHGADGGFERTLIRRGVLPWGFPPLAVDPGSDRWAHRVYAVWLEAAGAEGLNIFAAHSDDEGRSWSAPVRVNSDARDIFRGHPYVAVNGDGVVAVQWNDRRHGEQGACSDTYFAASVDGGASFQPEVRVTPTTSCPDTPANGNAAERWPSGGDYSGMAAGADGAFHLVWSDSRNEVFQVWTARVSVTR